MLFMLPSLLNFPNTPPIEYSRPPKIGLLFEVKYAQDIQFATTVASRSPVLPTINT